MMAGKGSWVEGRTVEWECCRVEMLEANLMMVFAVLDDFDQYLRVDHWQWNRRVKASILDHVLHGDGAESDLLLNLEDLLLFRLQLGVRLKPRHRPSLESDC